MAKGAYRIFRLKDGDAERGRDHLPHIMMQKRIDNLPQHLYDILRSVPKRGTVAWEEREVLRHRLGCKCISWGMAHVDSEL